MMSLNKWNQREICSEILMLLVKVWITLKLMGNLFKTLMYLIIIYDSYLIMT
jgi:hypothetical protein